MSQEEKYKLALFAVIRNSAVMPQGVELGKTMHEINTMAVAVMAKIMESCDYENLKESYESVSNLKLEKGKRNESNFYMPGRFAVIRCGYRFKTCGGRNRLWTWQYIHY